MGPPRRMTGAGGPRHEAWAVGGKERCGVEEFLRFWQSFAGDIVSRLPQSPTVDSEALEIIAAYAGYVNYVFPVGKFLAYAFGLLAAVGVYYLVMIVLRMIRVIS